MSAAGSMVSRSNLRYLYGDVVERASLARDLLASVDATQLSGAGRDLRRRCVLGQYLGLLRLPDEVRANLAPFGAVEAVVVAHINLGTDALIVFRTADGAAAAIRRQAEIRRGLYRAVPPPKFALPIRIIEPRDIMVALYPPPATVSSTYPDDETEATSSSTTQDEQQEPTRAAEAPTTPAHDDDDDDDTRWISKPVVVFMNSPYEKTMFTPGRPPSGTTRFFPSWRSLIHGPVVGDDGHLWMDGVSVTFYDGGLHLKDGPIQVVPAPPPPLEYFYDRR